MCRLRHIIAFAIVALYATLYADSSRSTQLMPPGQQQFFNANGVPLAGGFVSMFIPNTSSCKTTWSDSAQQNPNACPIVLDASGSAVIYGSGCYTQQVNDSLNNLVYSKLTCEPGAASGGNAGSVVWGGTATGTANAITLPTATAFVLGDGQVIGFIPTATNTGSVTVAAGSQGAISVVKDTTGGPVALAGGEIVFSGSGNIVFMEYSAGQNRFHLINTAIPSASGTTAPLCGAVGLSITNFVSSPNTTMLITTRQVVMQSPTGQSINRSNVSVSTNITLGNSTSTPGGMDGEAPGTSAWINLFLIDNGAGPGSVGSLGAGNNQAPTMPSGYTYKCYVGSVRVDGSGNLLRTLQLGPRAQYLTTLIAPPTIVTSFGTNQANGISSVVPQTATQISLILHVDASIPASGSADAFVAPSSTYGGIASSPFVPCGILLNLSAFTGATSAAARIVQDQVCSFVIESGNVYTTAATSGGAAINSSSLNALGWTDAVNAN